MSFAAFATTYFTIPKAKKDRADLPRFDLLGAVLLLLVIFNFVYGFSSLGGKSQGKTSAYIAIVVFVTALPASLIVEC